jgi:hypothetical protein
MLRADILRTDPAIFDVWAAFVVAADRLRRINPLLPLDASAMAIREATEGVRLLRDGAELIGFVVRARVPMPKSTRDFIDCCHRFRDTFCDADLEAAPPEGTGPEADSRKGDAARA